MASPYDKYCKNCGECMYQDNGKINTGPCYANGSSNGYGTPIKHVWEANAKPFTWEKKHLKSANRLPDSKDSFKPFRQRMHDALDKMLDSKGTKVKDAKTECAKCSSTNTVKVVIPGGGDKISLCPEHAKQWMRVNPTHYVEKSKDGGPFGNTN